MLKFSTLLLHYRSKIKLEIFLIQHGRIRKTYQCNNDLKDTVIQNSYRVLQKFKSHILKEHNSI